MSTFGQQTNPYYNPAQQYGASIQAYPYNAPYTNMVFVTSVEEALYKATQRNSDVVFFDQDRPVFYRVKVDSDGRKSWMQFEYVAPDAAKNAPVTKSEFQEFVARLEAVEKSLNPEVPEDA